MKQQPLNPFENLGEQLVNISKAHAFDIVSEQVKDLLKDNEAMKDLLKWIVNEIETTPNELNDALLGLIKIRCNKALSQTETK